MSENATTITVTGIIGAAISAVLVVLILSASSCQREQSERQAALRETCVRSGGSIINNNGSDTFHCLQSGIRPEAR